MGISLGRRGWLAAMLVWAVSGAAMGCRSIDEATNFDPGAGAMAMAGAGGAAAEGGAPGSAAGGAPPITGQPTGGSPGIDEVPPPGGDEVDAAGVDPDPPAPVDDGGGPASDATGADDSGLGASNLDAVVSSDAAPEDAAAPEVPPPAGGGPIAACFADPLVISICHQLEPACQNCPPGGAPPANKLAATCFALVDKAKNGMATDAECAKFAVDNKCTVDKGGNACGSLNCGDGVGPGLAPGCNKANCLTVKGNGDGNKCKTLLAACPCQ